MHSEHKLITRIRWMYQTIFVGYNEQKTYKPLRYLRCKPFKTS